MTLRIYLLIAITAVGIACATSQKQKAVAAYQTAHAAFAAFQDAEEAAYKMKTIPSLTAEKHKEINAVLVQAFDVQIKVGHGLLLWRSGDPVPTSVTLWFKEAERVIGELRRLLPDDDRVKIAQFLLPWIKAIIETARILGLDPGPTLTNAAAKGVA